MQRARRLAVAMTAMSLLITAALSQSAGAVLADDGEPQLTATLDGRPIPLADVGRYYCDDFSYPVIQCSSSRLLPDARATLETLLTSTDYVTIWDQANFGGAYMNVSQDYSVLSLIGWNDRISSFRGKNAETGTFFVDWFYGGSYLSFCCNSLVGNLGSYNNSFSSIERT